MTLTVGWWAIPAAITAAVVIFGLWPAPRPSGYTSLGDSIVGAVELMAGIILALAAWLIWALFA